jgi:small-conductance mechanosensitive channel
MILSSILPRSLIVESFLGIFALYNPELAVAVVRDTIESLTEVSKYKVPRIRIDEFADSSINMGTCYRVPTKSMFQTRYKVNMAVVKALAEKNIEIPNFQRGVYIIDQPQA